MNFIAKFTTLLIAPLMLLNMLGGIVSGIWLAFLGEWAIIGYGFLATVLAGWFIGFAIMPSLIFVMPASILMERGYLKLGFFVGMWAHIYTVAVMSVWCILVLTFYLDIATSKTFIPILLWSYGVATGPIQWLAQKDLQSGNDASAMTTCFLQFAYIICALGVLFGRMSIQNFVIVFAVLMTIATIMQFAMAYSIDRNRRIRL